MHNLARIFQNLSSAGAVSVCRTTRRLAALQIYIGIHAGMVVSLTKKAYIYVTPGKMNKSVTYVGTRLSFSFILSYCFCSGTCVSIGYTV